MQATQSQEGRCVVASYMYEWFIYFSGQLADHSIASLIQPVAHLSGSSSPPPTRQAVSSCMY